MATTRTEKRSRKKKKPPQQFKLSYSLMLLFAMLIVGTVAGVIAFGFGKQALEGVNQSPAGVKLPKLSPTDKPKESPKSSPSNKPDNKVSFLLNESKVILEMKARSQQELGNTTRPNFVIKPSGDRKVIQSRVDKAYISMRDPLAISASADERIADRIAELRQRVYTSSRSYESVSERPTSRYERYGDRPLSNQDSANLPLLSSPIELTPIRSRWQDRDLSLSSPQHSQQRVVAEDVNMVAKPTSGSALPERPRATTVKN